MDTTLCRSDQEAAAKIARLIAPDQPAWLVRAIEIVALPLLRREIASFIAYPSRAELRPKIETITHAIETLKETLLDRGVWSQIVANSPAGDASRERLERFADVVMNDSPSILAALVTAKTNVRVGRGGAGASLHSKAPKPGEVCAALVTTAWAAVHGRQGARPLRQTVVGGLCCPWAVAGGDVRLRRAEGGGWRVHLRAVADIPAALLDGYSLRFLNIRRLVEAGHLA